MLSMAYHLSPPMGYIMERSNIGQKSPMLECIPINAVSAYFYLCSPSDISSLSAVLFRLGLDQLFTYPILV